MNAIFGSTFKINLIVVVRSTSRKHVREPRRLLQSANSASRLVVERLALETFGVLALPFALIGLVVVQGSFILAAQVVPFDRL